MTEPFPETIVRQFELSEKRRISETLLSGKNLFPPCLILWTICIILITNILFLTGQAPLGAKY
jgi:hypothetical protein